MGFCSETLQAGGGGIQHNRAVQMVRHEDLDQVERRASQHLPVVAVDLRGRHAPGGAALLRQFRHAIADGDDARARILQVFERVQVRNAPGADEANPQFAHGVLLLRRLVLVAVRHPVGQRLADALHLLGQIVNARQRQARARAGDANGADQARLRDRKAARRRIAHRN